MAKQIKTKLSEDINELGKVKEMVRGVSTAKGSIGLGIFVWFAVVAVMIILAGVVGLLFNSEGVELAIMLISVWVIGPFAGRRASDSLKKRREAADQPRIEGEYQTALRREATRLENENRQKALLQPQLNNINQLLSSTEKILKELYGYGIIFPKYRSLIPVAMFAEYIESGRCSDLQGHEGAYNIFENELRLNRIINKMEVVIERLDSIQQTQYMLYDAVTESNRIAAAGLGELHEMGKSAALTAMYTKESARNSKTLVELNRDPYGTLRTKYGQYYHG
jgi:hypothetical protein